MGEGLFGAWRMREEGLSLQWVGQGPHYDSVPIVLENFSILPRISFPMKDTAFTVIEGEQSQAEIPPVPHTG